MYIEIDHINYGYEPERLILQDFSLTINKGEAVALMGANGCGKTTLLNILSGIVVPTAGTFIFDGENTTTKAQKDALFMKGFHQRVGAVFQNAETQLFCPSVYDEIAFGPRQMGLSEEAVHERVQDMADLLKLQGLLEKVPYHLSGGQKKRVTMAATLALNPDVLLMDEPMAALDPRTQTFVMNLIQSLRQARKTIIIATHDLHRVNDMVDRIVLFDESHAADGTPNEVLSQVELLQSVNLVDEQYHVHIHQHDGDDIVHLHM